MRTFTDFLQDTRRKYASDRLRSGFGLSDIDWRDQMIRDLRKALKFYADAKNYQQSEWRNSDVQTDSGKIAREALEKQR